MRASSRGKRPVHADLTSMGLDSFELDLIISFPDDGVMRLPKHWDMILLVLTCINMYFKSTLKL